MFKEFTDLLGLPVITDKGLQLGVVGNVIVDLDKHSVYELLVVETNPDIVDEGRDVAVPFRWIQNIGNTIVLKYFPGKIKVKMKDEFEGMPRRKQRKVKPQFGEGGIVRRPWS